MTPSGTTVVMVIFFLVVLGLLLLVRFIGSEDDWIRDSRGVWIRHGHPSLTPNYVKEQQQTINCAIDLFNQKNLVMNFSSQCLGSCGDYAVDIVHVPRIEEDNLIENQCESYAKGMTNNFIELDKNGEIQKIH